MSAPARYLALFREQKSFGTFWSGFTASVTADEITRIVDIQMRDLQKRLAERKITIELTEEARRTLAERGYDPVFGARPLKRAIQRMVENPLAVEILGGRFREGDHIIVDTKDRETFTFSKRAAVEQPA